MNFIAPEFEHYCTHHSDEEPELLARINRDTYAEVLMPRMLAGHFQGRVLATISKMIKPRRILEIGTYTGYSALCLAEGLAPNGELHSLEVNDELETRILRNWSASPLAPRLHLHIGDALVTLPTLDPDFDLVFIDADKERYLAYYEWLIERLPQGAHLLADNVLWSGKVLAPLVEMDAETRALHDFNSTVQSDPRVENVMLPIRDGILLIRKK